MSDDFPVVNRMNDTTEQKKKPSRDPCGTRVTVGRDIEVIKLNQLSLFQEI